VVKIKTGSSVNETADDKDTNLKIFYVLDARREGLIELRPIEMKRLIKFAQENLRHRSREGNQPLETGKKRGPEVRKKKVSSASTERAWVKGVV